MTIVEIHGTFTGSGMPSAPADGPKQSYALLGAIVETVTPTFFKLTGPEKTVTAAKADFDKFINSRASRRGRLLLVERELGRCLCAVAISRLC